LTPNDLSPFWNPFLAALAFAKVTAVSHAQPLWQPDALDPAVADSQLTLSHISVPFQSWQTTTGIFLHYGGIGQFAIPSGGQCIHHWFEAAHTQFPGEIIDWVISTVVSIAFHEHSILSLHASCVTTQGQAVALAGPSGSGKSSLAAACVAAGADLLSDDVTPVAVVDGQALALPFASSLRLMPDVADHWLDEATRSKTYSVAFEKHIVPAIAFERQPLTQPVPLRAVLVLQRVSTVGEDEALSDPLSGHALASVFLKNSYLGSTIYELGMGEPWLKQVEALSRVVPVRLLRYRNGRHGLDEARGAVFNLLKQVEPQS
jgi:hypothetical protein